MSQLTDWQTYKKFTIIGKQCTNIQGMSSKSFKKTYHLELEISLYLSNFSKEVSQLTDWQTYKKFRIIWNLCVNINVSKNCRKISDPEVEISLYKGSNEARILAWGQNSGHLLKMAWKWPEFCHLARILFSDWHAWNC